MSAVLRPEQPRHRWLRRACIGAGMLLGLLFVTLPLGAEAQAALTFFTILLYLVMDRFGQRTVSLLLVVVSVLVTSRYLFWRAVDTIEFENPLQTVLVCLLFFAELYAGLLMALSYLQTVWPLDRKPVPLPRDPADWPTVDIYIPTYNETLDIVAPTVLAAMNIDWPREKVNVWLLDDGRRQEMRDFARRAGCGYIIRPDNKGAKAGNLNHAMRHTTGEYIAIFDCDHAPTRAFLQLTVGWLLRDRRLAMVQTPHYFYSPDPFERNLARKRQVPNEGLLFYGVIQQGNDLWNAAFFCGSCAVIRRTALEEVGGVAHETVTEDAHTAFRMQQKGWHTAYIRIPMAAGLATERLSLHIGQRMRWARGMIQILRLENTLFARGLSMVQRLCYFTAQFGFMFAIPRIIFLCSPLAFLFLGQSVIAASPLAIIAYAGGHMFHAVCTTARLNGRHRHSFWSEIYEASLAFPLVSVTLLTLWDPRKGKFNVTDKGGTLEAGYLDVRAVYPNIILLVLLLLGLGIGVHGVLTTEVGSLPYRAYLLNSIWALLCLVPVSAAIAVGLEREQMRTRARAEVRLPVVVIRPDGSEVSGATVNLSLSGVQVHLAAAPGLAEGDRVRIRFLGDTVVPELPANLVRWDGEEVFCQFALATLADEAALARIFFGRPDAWLHWDNWPVDRPVRSLGNVVAATADAVFRKYRLGFTRKRAAAPARQAAAQPANRVTDVVPPRRIAAALLFGLLMGGGGAAAQPSSPTFGVLPPVGQPPVAQPLTAQPPGAVPDAGAPPPAEATRTVRRSLREFGLRSPMQLRGVSDLQGVLFGLRANEVVTEARLSVYGGASPALIPSLSQIAITLNEQAVGTITLDASRQTFGPVEYPLDPLFFTELNRLNFRFSGRYSAECNDPLSGLLWATISDTSTLTMQVARLPPQRDLARLPEPLFDRRLLNEPLTLPFVIAEGAGANVLRAAGIAASWFAVAADYRGATFPVERQVPASGDAVVLAVGPDAFPGLALPRFEGPTLALVANPADPDGTLLVIGGRNETDAAAAAAALAVGRAGLSGEMARVAAPQIAPRRPYDAPRWIATDGPVQVGRLLQRSDLQAQGYAPGPVRVPLRTAPDLFTWRNRGFPVDIQFRPPSGSAIDLAAARLDVLVSDSYLKSIPLASGSWGWPLSLVADWVGGDTGTGRGSALVPPYLLLGREELQLRFDLRPLARGECAATPGDVRAAVEPGTTIDLSRAYRYARMPNLGYFASSGFPFTRMADLSGTAVVLPERPNTLETGVFLDVLGMLAATVGLPATGVQVVPSSGVAAAAGRDLLVIGALNRQPALTTLLRDTPVKLEGGRLVMELPDMLQDVRAALFSSPSRGDRTRAATALADGSEGLGVVLSAESPLQSGRTVVALTGATPAAVAAVAAALRAPETAPQIQGDLTLLAGGQVAAFTTQARYGVGDLPFWLLPQAWAEERAERAMLLLLAAAALLALPLYWILRRRRLLRLRARTPP